MSPPAHPSPSPPSVPPLITLPIPGCPPIPPQVSPPIPSPLSPSAPTSHCPPPLPPLPRSPPAWGLTGGGRGVPAGEAALPRAQVPLVLGTVERGAGSEGALHLATLGTPSVTQCPPPHLTGDPLENPPAHSSTYPADTGGAVVPIRAEPGTVGVRTAPKTAPAWGGGGDDMVGLGLGAKSCCCLPPIPSRTVGPPAP